MSWPYLSYILASNETELLGVSLAILQMDHSLTYIFISLHTSFFLLNTLPMIYHPTPLLCYLLYNLQDVPAPGSLPDLLPHAQAALVSYF